MVSSTSAVCVLDCTHRPVHPVYAPDAMPRASASGSDASPGTHTRHRTRAARSCRPDHQERAAADVESLGSSCTDRTAEQWTVKAVVLPWPCGERHACAHACGGVRGSQPAPSQSPSAAVEHCAWPPTRQERPLRSDTTKPSRGTRARRPARRLAAACRPRARCRLRGRAPQEHRLEREALRWGYAREPPPERRSVRRPARHALRPSCAASAAMPPLLGAGTSRRPRRRL